MRLLLVLLFTYLSVYAASIAKIPEASGICYIKDTKQLIVVNDEGWIYKLTTDGKILKKKHLGKYDLEGVAYDAKNDLLLLAVEGKNAILIVTKDDFKIIKEVKIKKKYKGRKILDKSKNGIEAITIIKGDIHLAKQSKIESSDDYVIFEINNLKKEEAKIKKIYLHSYKDIAGLDFYKGHLYMVSDKKNLLIKYDLKNNKTLKTIKLPDAAQEGICFDDKHFYIADDNGDVLKYKIKNVLE